MANWSYTKGANRPPRFGGKIKPMYLKTKTAPTYTVTIPFHVSNWTDWFYIKSKNYWTRELRLTDNDQPWD